MKNKILLVLFCCIYLTTYAQKTTKSHKIRFTKVDKKQEKETPLNVLSSQLKPISGTEFRKVKSKSDKKNFIHTIYQQYYKGVKIEYGQIKFHEQHGLLKSYSGVYYKPTALSTSPKITKQKAISIAKEFIGGNNVFWLDDNGISQTNTPKIELVILPNRKNENLNLAYKIGLGSSKGKLRMGFLYINAQTGEVLKYKNQVYFCFDENKKNISAYKKNKTSVNLSSGTAATAYSGNQNIETTFDGSNYILYDQSRANTGSSLNTGNGQKRGITTVDFNHTDDLSNYAKPEFVTEFTDNDNTWTAAEMSANEDQYALDAHWGAQVVYDYWKNKQGRTSYDDADGAIISYVHYDTNYTNAGWVAFNDTKGFMVYGDGGGSYTPLTNLDVVSHEIAHGVNNATASLDYELESGALNEAFSDIWAMVIDNYANETFGTSKNMGLLNDENGGGVFRSMSNPNAYGQPDTYQGTYWYDVSSCTPDGTNNDYCGVHTNSGVLNYWFWLLSQGGSGTNDNGDSFNVTALGIDAAAAIAYRMQDVYLTSTSDYQDARNAGIQAAKDLYGNCSTEETAVTNAFYAVGVGNIYSGEKPSINTDISNIEVCENTNVILTTEAGNADTSRWQVNDGNGWSNIGESSTYSGVNSNSLTIVTDLTLNGYKYRNKYTNNCGNTNSSSITLTVEDLPITTSISTGAAGCLNNSDGTITFNFDDNSSRTNIEFSIDGGNTYPYNYKDNVASATITNLSAGDYDIWVRWGNNECPVNLGVYTIETVISPTATINSQTEASLNQSDGILQVSFGDISDQTKIKFSVDGGSTYPYEFDDSLTTAELTGLSAGTYSVWIATGDDSCAKYLEDVTINEIAYTQIPDANFESALNDLGYDNYLGYSKVPTSLINTLTSINIRLKNIIDLTGIEDFTALEVLYADNNNFKTLDFSNNTALKVLQIYSNPDLSSFKVADPSIITRVTLSNCNLSGAYDFSAYTSLVNLSVKNNDLTSLNVQNGNNTNFTYFHAGGNANLNCIIVDDADYSTTNWTSNGGASYSSTFCEYTAIPDTNFEAALEALGYDDISGDNQVPTELINTVTSLTVSSKSISDLTGIEDFTALETLNCKANSITTLNLSGNPALISVTANQNDIANVDVSQNLALQTLIIGANELTTIDVSNNTELTRLDVLYNNLTSLNTSNNTKLLSLRAYNTGITSFDFTNNALLETVQLYNNSLLTAIDVSNLTKLEELRVNNTGVAALDVSNNLNLEILRVSKSEITTLNLTNQTKLTQLYADNTNINYLNIRNGNNINVTQFYVNSTPNLSCVIVDDAAFSTTNWTNIDIGATYSELYCNYTSIPDSNFEAALEALGYDDISADGQVPTVLINTVSNLDVGSENISDLTGIEDFAALTKLTCNNNSIKNLDLRNNSLLEYIKCDDNNMEVLSLEGLLNFEDLVGFGNDFTSFDFSTLPKLKKISLFNNELTTLDLSQNSALAFVRLDQNDLTYLNVKNGNNTNITVFNTNNNYNLNCIIVDDATYSTTNWTSINPTTSFNETYCSYTTIPDLTFEKRLETLGYDDISGDGKVPTSLIKDVTYLYVPYTSLNTVADLTGIEDFTALKILNCSGSNLSSIDLSSNLKLESVDLSNNNITSINLTGLTALNSLKLSGNSLSSLEVSSSTLLSELNISGNSLSSIDVSNNIELKNFNINSNTITVVDLTNNTLLESFSFSSCPLTTLDLSKNINLTYLEAEEANKLTTLDLSLLTLLEEVYLSDCVLLNQVNIKNGNNTSISDFDATGCTNLSCISVNDVSYATANWSIDGTTNFTTYDCRYTLIPDANFEGALEALGYDDISGDGQVPTELIEVVTTLSLNNKGITNLTGIEDFKLLKTLSCSDNTLTNIDVSSNALLEFLNISYSSISSIDITKNTLLKQFYANGNPITSVDFSNNLALETIEFYGNLLETIDVSNNINLKYLDLYQNKLTSIDLTNNTQLTTLYLEANNLTSLELTKNTLLENFTCSNNELGSLNIKNGNNTNINEFNIVDNPNLTCVLVDNAIYSTTNWTNIDAEVSFNEVKCNTSLLLSAKVYLQGAYINPNSGEETLMRDDLRVAGGIYGPTSPYGDGAIISESVGTDDFGNNSMVDWIYVELRDAVDASIVVAGQSAVLQRDGDIVAVDGTSALTFKEVSNGNYYLVIKHRNHISIRSASAIALSSTNTTINLSNDTNVVLGGSNAMIAMDNGVYAMPSGDYDSNGQIQNSDISSIIQVLGSSGYLKADMDMNGQVQNSDINEIINTNIGKGQQF